MRTKTKKKFADSPLYSVVCSILAILVIITPVVLVIFSGVYIQFFLIMKNARTLGPWWVVLTALHILCLSLPAALLVYFRKRREARYIVGDELFFITQDKLLPLELRFERMKRVLREKLSHSSREKSRRELFLEDCCRKRKEMQEARR